jgi:hypothetical protein
MIQLSARKPRLRYPRMSYATFVMEPGLNQELIPPNVRPVKEQDNLHAPKDFLPSARLAAIAREKEKSFPMLVKSAADMGG